MDSFKLKSYYQLRDRTDRFYDSVAARYSDQIACTPGCSHCCQAGLSVVMVEAVALGMGLNISPERVHLQAGQSPLTLEGACEFLNSKKQCDVYADRPLVCRTHGMPLLLPNETTIHVCDLNFRHIDPHDSAVLNVENLNAALFAANMVYCQQEGLEPRSRVALDRLVSLVADE